MKKGLVLLVIQFILGYSTIIAQNYESLVSGVSTIWTSGTPSSLFPYNTSAVPLVNGNPNTASYPAIFSLASVNGIGRAIALAHEGIFSNNDVLMYSNASFALNIFNWLDQANTNQIAFVSGHSEFLNFNNATTLRTLLQNNGYTVSNINSTVTASSLAGKGAIMIGNSWTNYSESEKSAILTYVQNGGGLLLLGLGWSWVAYNSGGLSAYPMNQIGTNFGFYWTDTTISDPVNQAGGQPLFTTFYPDSYFYFSINNACTILNNITSTYSAMLPDILQSDIALRTDYINANILMKEVVIMLPVNHPFRQDVYNCYKDLINTYPTLFKKGVVYNPSTQNNFAWIRERIHLTVADALPLSIEQKIIVANLLGLSGKYLDIWNNFTILLADNTALDSNQKDYIFELFSAIQPALYNLRLMSFSSELGTAPTTSSGNVASFLAGINTGVNSFSNTIGTYPENQFPSEVPPGIADIFCSAAPHEANHIVDYFFIEGNTTLKNRKTQLIAQAGNDNLNYLRSTASAGFFVANPQEFIASIANEYFVDTKKTLDLALIRFNNGRSEPLNQFLYFANLYTVNNGNFTRFYNTDANCNFSFQQVGIGRDANNRLNQICYDDVQYSFTLNSIGNVIAYNTAACSNCYITPNITGGDEACPLVVYSYTTPFVAGSTYQWIVTGGIILSGQGTNTINVQWYNNVEGMVQLIKGN